MATFYWVGRINSSAAVPENWSDTSGGASTGSIPGASDNYVVNNAADITGSIVGIDIITFPVPHGLAVDSTLCVIGETPTDLVQNHTYYVAAVLSPTDIQIKATPSGLPMDNLVPGEQVSFSHPLNWNIGSCASLNMAPTQATKYVGMTTFGLSCGLNWAILSGFLKCPTAIQLTFTGSATGSPAEADKCYVLIDSGVVWEDGTDPSFQSRDNLTFILAGSTAGEHLIAGGQYPRVMLKEDNVSGFFSPRALSTSHIPNPPKVAEFWCLDIGAEFRPTAAVHTTQFEDSKRVFAILPNNVAGASTPFTNSKPTFDGGMATWQFYGTASAGWPLPITGMVQAYGAPVLPATSYTAKFHSIEIKTLKSGYRMYIGQNHILKCNQFSVLDGANFYATGIIASEVHLVKRPVIRGSWDFKQVADGIYRSHDSACLPVVAGGTGNQVVPDNALLVGNQQNSLNILNPGSNTQVLTMVGGSPQWAAASGGGGGGSGEANQNAFSNVAVAGQSTVEADTATDTLTLVGSGATSITTTAGTDTITITSTDTNTQLTDGQIAAMGYIKTDTNTQLSQEQVEDYINGLLTAGSNISLTYDDAAGTLTIAATDTNTQLSTEDVQDIVGAMVSGNTETNIAVTYDDAGGKLNFESTDTDTNTQLSQEQVEDYVNGVIVAGSNISKTYDDAAGTLTIAATDTNTQLSTEQVQDIVGAMFSSNTETGITATYQDADGTIDLVVTGFGGGGSSTFIDLLDTPILYDGSAGKFVAVNSSEDALEFVTAPSGGGGGGAIDNHWEVITPGATATASSGKTDILFRVVPDGSGSGHLIPNMGSDCTITVHNYERDPAPIGFTEGVLYHPMTGGPHPDWELAPNSMFSAVYITNFDGGGTNGYFHHSEENFGRDPTQPALMPL